MGKESAPRIKRVAHGGEVSLDLSLRLNDSTGKMQVSIRIFFDT